MLKKVLIGVVVLVAILVAVIATRPADFKVERATVINAPAERVFAQINDFHAWEQWSPWAKIDPQAKNVFSGAPSGVGQVFAWAGNSDVGEGRMTVEQSQPPERVGIKIEFLKPMQATNTAVFVLTPDAQGVKVTWTMTGKNDFIGKAFCLVVDMDKMVGKDFEKGLASLKTVAEAEAQHAPAAAPASPVGSALPH